MPHLKLYHPGSARTAASRTPRPASRRNATRTFSDCRCRTTRHKNQTRSVQRKALADEFLAPSPQRLCVLRIERVGADAGHRVRIVRQLPHSAVLTVAAAHIFGISDNGGPDGRRRALRHRLEPGWLAHRVTLHEELPRLRG